MLARCGEQYRRRHLEGEIIPPGIALIIGSGTHKSIDLNMRTKMEDGQLCDLAEVKASARDYVVHQFERGAYWLSPGERAESKSRQHWQDGAVETAVGLSSLHHQTLAHEIQPTAVERKWLVKLKGYPCDLAGTLDIQEDGRIRDTKTKGKTPPQSEADCSDQLTMYGMAVKVLDKKQPAEYRLDALVKLEKPKAVSYRTYRDEEDFKVLLRRIETSIKTIEAGLFIPTNRDNWWCSAKFCGYHSTCPFVRGRKQFAMGG
jgi:hypothetical protein